jgi:hypothetical protein
MRFSIADRASVATGGMQPLPHRVVAQWHAQIAGLDAVTRVKVKVHVPTESAQLLGSAVGESSVKIVRMQKA